MALFDRPSAANRQMRARSTVRCGLVVARTQAANVVRCSFVIFRAFAFSHMPQRLSQWGSVVKLLLGHYTRGEAAVDGCECESGSHADPLGTFPCVSVNGGDEIQ